MTNEKVPTGDTASADVARKRALAWSAACRELRSRHSDELSSLIAAEYAASGLRPPRRRRTAEELAAAALAKEQAKQAKQEAREAKRAAANAAKIAAAIAKHEAIAAELRASLPTIGAA